MSTHALLSPSSSHRWINCTPAARIEEKYEDHGSVFAAEGSIAHAGCEAQLLDLLGLDAREAKKEYEAGAEFHSKEMEECIGLYVATVWDKYQSAKRATPDAKLFVERRLDFTKWVPEAFGTADAIIIADGLMEVIDFKYGKGVEVSAIQNTQMMIYALGAISEFEMEYDIEKVRMTIVQPRKSNYSEFELSVSDLVNWAVDVLMPAAKIAFKGEGEQKPGEWCKFCKAKATCSKLANQAISVYTQHEEKAEIKDEEMSAILALIPAIKSWCTAVEEYATAKAIAGTQFDGFKLVEGRSIRTITDQSELAVRLKSEGFEDVYKAPELKTLTELEKMVGKKKFMTLSDGLIHKPQGKPTLVPLSDKREPMNVNSAEEDFKNIK